MTRRSRIKDSVMQYRLEFTGRLSILVIALCSGIQFFQRKAKVVADRVSVNGQLKQTVDDGGFSEHFKNKMVQAHAPMVQAVRQREAAMQDRLDLSRKHARVWAHQSQQRILARLL